MKIAEILPELDIGGVERHVIDLSNELSKRGHEITVISAG
ncbi:MAG: glycosyltransferase, partial [Synergistes sp.]|nr:glycosyltransferase [Synergistes sp.]